MTSIVAPPSKATPTQAEAVYRALRADILWGNFAPDAPLRSAELCARYKAGISPLREALSRLLGERLVTLVEQRGFRVASIDAASVIDTMEMRLLIETAALRRSICNGDVAWEARIIATQHAFARTPVPQGPGMQCELWADRHRDFHMGLISACGSALQMEYATRLFDQSLRQMIIIVLGFLSGEMVMERDREGEHDDIVRATLARDADAAVAHLDAHHRLSTRYVLSALPQLQSEQRRTA